jgi:amidase
MARTVRDAAVLLGVLAGVDPRDPATAGSDANAPEDYTQFLVPDGLQGARIGVARHFFGFHEKVDAVLEVCLQVLRDQGAELVDPAGRPPASRVAETELEVLLYEFKADLNAYLAERGPDAPVHSLAEVIEYNQRHRDRVMPYFGQDLMLKAEAKGPLTSEDYEKALQENYRLARAEGIDAALREHQLDAIVAPTTGPAWLTDLVNGNYHAGGCSSPAAVAGYPHISVPAGYVHGLPVGLSFFSGAYREPLLLRLAYAFEQATQARRPPDFRPTVTLD